MIRDFKYIIKRILIGVGIALIIGFLRGNLLMQAHALQAISSWQMPAQESSITTDSNAVFWYTNSTVFANQGDGELLFNFSITKQYGDSTAPVLAPRFVRVHSGGDSYVCYIGSSTLNNSTFTDGTYSAICPMHIESAGLTSVVVAFQNLSTTNMSNYIVKFNGLFTWRRDYEYTLLDAINNKLNNIGNSDIINNNNQNTQNIINNQNNNTQSIIDSQQDINDSLNDDNVSGANSTINDFFNNFDTGSNGNLTDIISLPLDFLQSLNNSCSPIPLNLGPLGNYNLPCLKSVLTAHFPTAFIDLITLLVNGFLCYRILTSLMIFINNLKDPNNADLEVMDL